MSHDTVHALSGRVALVTGGARRVGRAVALGLAEAGMDVALTYRSSRDEAEEVVDCIAKMGRQALAIEADLGRTDAAEGVHRRFVERFTRLDALINNASTFEPGAIGGLDAVAFDAAMAVNARGPMLLMQQFAPMLAADYPANCGRIVNFIDIHVLGQPLAGYMAYNASKAALYEITKTAAIELAPKVTVNAIAPGVVAWADSYTEAERAAYLTRVPLARPGTPGEAASAVLFLVRDADYCTGQVIRLDGGRFWT